MQHVFTIYESSKNGITNRRRNSRSVEEIAILFLSRITVASDSFPGSSRRWAFPLFGAWYPGGCFKGDGGFRGETTPMERLYLAHRSVLPEMAAMCLIDFWRDVCPSLGWKTTTKFGANPLADGSRRRLWRILPGLLAGQLTLVGQLSDVPCDKSGK